MARRLKAHGENTTKQTDINLSMFRVSLNMLLLLGILNSHLEILQVLNECGKRPSL